VTLKGDSNVKYAPLAFTEQGIAKLFNFIKIKPPLYLEDI
jgi:hypothetical protein